MLACLLLMACGPSATSFECTDPLGCLELAPDNPLVIGLILTVSGENADQGLAALDSIQGALDAQARLLGHRLVLARQDSDCSAPDARRAALRLSLEAGLVAVIGPSCAADLETILPILEEAGLSLLTPDPLVDGAALLVENLLEAIEQVSYQSSDGSLFIPRQALERALQTFP